ncbi:MAG: tRNA 2-thiouridine(34) synthase MnmA, partial [bacterium]|nr:tRNA 2-thiouridine(34) synthase MnmA [bacterium]
GNTIGNHNGLHLFTVGQRRGINCPASDPYYVVKIDTTHNCLIVGFKKDLFSSECRVKDINWIHKIPTTPTQVYSRVRYRNKPVLSTLVPIDKHTATVKFAAPQSAITPGQGAVFYRDDEILGGGWIDKINEP